MNQAENGVLSHKVMHVQLQVTVEKIIYLLSSYFRLKMNSLEFTV